MYLLILMQMQVLCAIFMTLLNETSFDDMYLNFNLKISITVDKWEKPAGADKNNFKNQTWYFHLVSSNWPLTKILAILFSRNLKWTHILIGQRIHLEARFNLQFMYNLGLNPMTLLPLDLKCHRGFPLLQCLFPLPLVLCACKSTLKNIVGGRECKHSSSRKPLRRFSSAAQKSEGNSFLPQSPCCNK